MEKKGVFITLRNLDNTGISKKIIVQKTRLAELCNSSIDFFYCKDDFLFFNEQKIIHVNRHFLTKTYIKVSQIINIKKYDFVYLRYEAYSSPAFISFLKKISSKKLKIVFEIPTYPYDGELLLGISKANGIRKINRYKNLLIEKKYRRYLIKYVNRIVTYSTDDFIYKIKTLKITNGIDLDSVKLVNRLNKNNEITLIGVAKLTPYHGYDRVILGLSNYLRTENQIKINFIVVGGSDDDTYDKLKKLTKDLSLEEYVHFTNNVPYEELDSFFEKADIGIGSLARHRSGISTMASLKNREYAARGIPFIYSENDLSFDDKDFVLKVKQDDSPLDFNEIINFYMKTKKYSPILIRKSVEKLDWKEQLKVISNYLLSEE